MTGSVGSSKERHAESGEPQSKRRRHQLVLDELGDAESSSIPVGSSSKGKGKALGTSKVQKSGLKAFNTFAPSTPALQTPTKAPVLKHLAPPTLPIDLRQSTPKSSAKPVQRRTAFTSLGEAKAGGEETGSGRKVKNFKALTSFDPRPTSPQVTPKPKAPVNLKPISTFTEPLTTTSSSSSTKNLKLKPQPRSPKDLRPALIAFQPGSPSKPVVESSISSRADKSFEALPKMEAKEEDLGASRRLLETVPLAPPPEEGGEAEGSVDMWSPKKKKGHKIAGLASRASGIITSARTEHTLWLHSLSRSLTQGSSLSRTLLLRLLQPAIRLKVVDVLGSKLPPTANFWEESKTLMTSCRLLLSDEEKEEIEEEDQGPTELDLEGLVMLSLHFNNSALATSTSATRSTISPNGICIPANPHDLTLVKRGVEIWVWEPFQEILLSGARTTRSSGGESEVGVGGDVFWDSRPREVIEKEREEREMELKEAERVKKALLCSRFGFFVR